uniref:Very-long-chain (3R)-3-hydroxyacyl-CoA dehydratase n=1 Tax=Cacopsylla melanoneura TaxID=428564 RepID=A0A8D8QU28_9HEMI
MAETKDPAAKPKSKEQNPLVKTYLLAYNFGQVIGWSYLLLQMIGHYLSINKTTSLWDTVYWTVIIFQNAALVEVVNVALGLVKSNLALTFFQVMSRVMVVVGILIATPTGPASPGLPLCLFAWTVTEIIRYLFYALNLINAVPDLLIWCRYTFFIALYPIGITGELLCMWWAQSWVAETKLWSMELPNAINFTFSYQYFIIYVMLLYIPLFPQLYLHMFGQRKKILGGGSKPPVAKKTK